MYIQNAGLVIAAPFLKKYFITLGLLDGEAFTDETAALRAVRLLEYVASGRTEAAEHELVFNKVLCGLPLTTPVPENIALTEHEVVTTRQLLKAVLYNWEQMGNSSVENLQGSFFMRNAQLNDAEDHWSLLVESAAYDVVLGFLPWTISVIHLPWMPIPVITTWPVDL